MSKVHPLNLKGNVKKSEETTEGRVEQPINVQPTQGGQAENEEAPIDTDRKLLFY